MVKTILIKPVITEKADRLTNRLQQYTFIVARDANKIEIQKAVEARFNVAVESVNTLVLPAKTKNRLTRSGYLRGLKPAYKKAVVTLAEGEEIDFFGDI
ncbi:MAG: 50S ribosomal protein L23 [Saprospiraceae bacterium]